MDIFSIIGPVMIGPSSSHTAGAVKIGRAARLILGEAPQKAHVILYGSFAKTGRGHGTDKAICAGLLGFLPDDIRIRDSIPLAKDEGLALSFAFEEGEGLHPNTARITLSGAKNAAVITASSLGGGHIVVCNIDGLEVAFSGEYHTLIVMHRDEPGAIAAVCAILEHYDINIAQMSCRRGTKGGDALMILELDRGLTPAEQTQLIALPVASRVIPISPI
ncbi:L-serine ammonia-lyase, iron-sulfur-dependent subunit beta [Eubacteriales bacterium OttesenSCG-928-M02]|nr:L-serine ammonia-lyase, iron-sulfur-dependent subunit beta [Eubacteriales bacterium OttesenSCG-928-M02]